MKRKKSASSSSSSSSDSCIIKPNVGDDDHQKQPSSAAAASGHESRAKRVRKKQQKPDNSTRANNGTKRSSIYRGVTRHRWTGRYEAHLWDKGTWNNIQNKKGKQIYLGAYDNEEAAARTYDLAALKYWGPDTTLNFQAERYSKEIEEMQKLSKEEYLASLRRLSSGFSRGVSKYRGVARHHHNGRWEARIGRVSGNKYLYLGTYNTQEEAAVAYDKAAIAYRGANAVTNFHISNYINNDDDNDKVKKPRVGDEIKEEETPESSIGEHLEVVKHEEVASSKESSGTEEKVEEEASRNPKAEEEEYADVNPGKLIKQEVPAEFIEELPHLQEETEGAVAICLKYETEATMMVMDDSPKEDELEHPWDICLDLALHSLPDSDILHMDDKERSLSDLFGDIEIPDSIDFMFDNPAYGYEFDLNKDAMLSTTFAKEKEVGAKQASTSPSSTTTSV